MSDTKKTWLTVWDDMMIELLSPIAAEAPPKLQMLFFANTFPLAYHYAIALKRAGAIEQPRDYIVSGKWGESEEPNQIFYTNKGDKEGISHVPVTLFRPQYAFVPLTLATSQIWNNLLHDEDIKKRTPPIPSISEFLDKAKNKYKYNKVVIYAEIEDLGNYLNNMIKDKCAESNIIVKQNQADRIVLPVLGFDEPVPNMLRVFIYGGSLSSYLLRKKDRYLCLMLGNGINENNKMKTYVSCPSKYSDILNNYHLKLYQAANELKNNGNNKNECPPFFSVYRSYNEMAWLLQHRSSFKDAHEFAECLCEHHEKMT